MEAERPTCPGTHETNRKAPELVSSLQPFLRYRRGNGRPRNFCSSRQDFSTKPTLERLNFQLTGPRLQETTNCGLFAFITFNIYHTAVMTHRALSKGVRDGKEFSNDRRSLHVFVKRNGRWQVIANAGVPAEPST